MFGLLFLLVVLVENVFSDTLLSVVLVARHGARTPVRPYPTDPFKNESLWPYNFGQLTKEGKIQHHELGKWLRDRYDFFLPQKFSTKDVYALSTDYDRTLMSAMANLNGLFPPNSTDFLDSIYPVHMIPKAMDNLLRMKMACPKREKIKKELRKTIPYILDLNAKLKDTFSVLEKNSKLTVRGCHDTIYLYDALFIEEKEFNLTIPSWANGMAEKLWPCVALGFLEDTLTHNLTRLALGPIFHQMLYHFQNFGNVSVGEQNIWGRKLTLLFAHDFQIINILNGTGVFDNVFPTYADTIIFEMWRSEPGNGKYIRMIRKHLDQLTNLTLPGCEFDCKLETFSKLLSPILMTRKEWVEECYSGSDTIKSRIFLIVFLVMFLEQRL